MTTTSAPEGAPSATAPADAGTASASSTEPVEDLAALRAAAAELAALKAEAAAARKVDRDARKRAQEEAEKAGELAKALETAKSRLAEVESVEPLAAKWRAYEEAESKRLDEEAKALPDAVRDLYGAAADIEGRRKVLAAFRAMPSAPAAAAPKAVGVPPALGAPPGVSTPDIEAALADPSGRKLAEIKARDPSAVASFFSSLLGPRGQTNSLGVGRFARPTKAQNT